jgi:putative FmdB family regulatory protein
MPIYEYHCDRCGERVEVLVRSSAAVPHCPLCGAVLRERLFSAPHVLRGTDGPARGETCCGREDRCDAPPCSAGGTCRRG